MPTTLTIDISGLCLLVPRDKGTSLWVFMPKTHGKHKHVPTVVYDASYDDPTKSGPVKAPIEGELQHIVGASAGDVRPGIAEMNGNQWKIHKRGPAADWFAASLDSALKARIEGRAWLANVTSLEPGSIGVDWDYDGQVMQLVTSARCTMTLPGNSVDLRVQGGGTHTIRTPGNSMHLQLLHVPPNELPPDGKSDGRCPGKGKPPEHWHFYRSMLAVPSSDTKMPRLHDECPSPEEARDAMQSKGSDFELHGINPYACMTVPGCPEDDPDCVP